MLTDAQILKRTNYLGASDAPRLYDDPVGLYLEKTGQLEPLKTTEAMAIGDMVEDSLLDWAIHKLGSPIERGLEYSSDVWTVHPDGVIVTATDAYIVEAKTSGIASGHADLDLWGEDGTDHVPDRVIIQTQIQMEVARQARAGFDCQMAYVPALIAGRGRVMYEVPYDAALATEIYRRGVEWWKHVRDRVQPAAESAMPLDVLRRRKRTEGKAVEIPRDVLAVYDDARAAKKDADDALDGATAYLLGFLGDAEIGIVEGVNAITYRMQQRKAYTVPESQFRVLRRSMSRNKVAPECTIGRKDKERSMDGGCM